MGAHWVKGITFKISDIRVRNFQSLRTKKGVQTHWTVGDYPCLPSVEEDFLGTPGLHASRKFSRKMSEESTGDLTEI